MITQLTENSIAIEVPGNTQNWKVTRIHADNDLVCPDGNGGLKWLAMIPEGNWQILGRPEQITKEQAENIVDRWNTDDGCDPYIWADYLSPYGACLPTALESFRSLLRSKNVPIDNVIILVKQ